MAEIVNKAMKIGIVTTWFERGAAYVSKQYMEALSEGNDLYVYARGGEQLADKGSAWGQYQVTWGDRRWGKDFSQEARGRNLNHFQQWVTDNQLDVVFFNEEHWWEPVMRCSGLGVKTGAYVDYYTTETMPFFRLYDFLICNTRRHYEAFKWHRQAYFVPWGTDLKLFVPRTDDLVEPGLVTFFHSAGMNPKRKGTDILIRAFVKLNQRDCKLVIHSQKPLKIFFPELVTVIEELERVGQLTCIEKTVAAPGLYFMGDVYVYPTILEGIGLTIAEALASGLPVITSDNPPMNEFINQDNGRLVKIDKLVKRDDDYYWPLCVPNGGSLIAEMGYYIDNIQDLSRLKKQARKYAEDKLDWENNGRALRVIFRDAQIITGGWKDEIKDLVLKYEQMKSSRLRRIIHKIKILKFSFLPFVVDFIYKKYLK